MVDQIYPAELKLNKANFFELGFAHNKWHILI